MNLDTEDKLRSVYRMARGAAVDKVITILDSHCVTFLENSPFMVLSTANADGVADGSPKGGEPGFARVLEDGRVGWADSSGNNRLDSFENVVSNPNVAMLFMIPGLDESLRINGTAELSTDPVVCENFAYGASPAKVVVLVTVLEAYIHCAKAYRRAGLWNPDSWLAPDAIPNGVAMLKDHAAIVEQVETLEATYNKDVEATLWKPGGDH
jgi:PPOX class probable FMN-dependent enzyme